ncbi:hypothetical protein KUH32_05720 [Thalassococcus sp. CAU 1522]|uniref:Lipoprotein n=1 Tax=Thalassococcus arenae TaxID=2851652 RepID=A0ABS6N5G8_9RHOB|nr:hypothetical protein [Thalassococcus arenae]MBV2359260.1 hypothetical protein [Thalassococcus arenae]
MRGLILVLALAFSGTVALADIGWNTARMTPGSVMVLKDSDGVERMHVARGHVQGLKRFDTYAGRGAGATYLGSYLTTATGDVVRQIEFDGVVTQFAPHRCNRTLGECRYTITHADGFVENRVRVTRATADGLVWQEHGLDGLMAEGAIELDADGVAKGGWRKQKSGKKVRTKRVMIALK